MWTLVAGADGSVQWDRLDASIVNTYVAERGQRLTAWPLVLDIVGAVRCLLRWALSTGHLDRDVTPGILKPPGTKRSLPRGVDAGQVAALLAACDPATALGARDRAVVLILVRLGLRAGEAARLTLDDIDWATGRVKVTGKGREHVLPLPVDVGQALEAWLRLRPPALDRAVFVRIRAPRQMMTVSGISGIVARLSGLAGIDPIHAHRLRHTAAMDVLAAGGTLTEAKELLGHAYTVTTMTYAKVDLESLRELVVPFGQVPDDTPDDPGDFDSADNATSTTRRVPGDAPGTGVPAQRRSNGRSARSAPGSKPAARRRPSPSTTP
ncbi:MAG: tyrosine-type recombinase/integrase [Candidatus Nanopelagicales bacterium]